MYRCFKCIGAILGCNLKLYNIKLQYKQILLYGNLCLLLEYNIICKRLDDHLLSVEMKCFYQVYFVCYHRIIKKLHALDQASGNQQG